MSWSLSAGTVLGVTAAVISAVVAVSALRYREKRMALQFFVLELGIAAWALLYALQLAQPTMEGQLFWQRLTFGAAGFLPVEWLLFTLAYTGRTAWLSRRRVAALVLPSAVWFVACLTNPTHGLIWTTQELVHTALGPVVALGFEPGYVVYILYSYTVILLGLLLLVIYASEVAPVYQKQVALLLLAASLPFTTHILFTLGKSPVPHLDLTPFGFALTGVFLGLALFRFNLLHLVPVAREQAFHESGDGLVVVNTEGEITDAIGVATEILDPAPKIGASIETVFPDQALEALDGEVKSITRAGEHRVYQCRVSSLSSHHGECVGTLLILRDITEMYESRQRLSVTNRLLRHNLRNDMTVILGHADALEADLNGESAAHARRIRETVGGFVELADKAKQVATLDETFEAERISADLVRLVRDVVDDQQAAHPEVRFEFDGPDELVVDDVTPDAFEIALENVVENAIEHNAAETPLVGITLTDTPEAVRIEVRDTGPGIPEMERKAIGAETETQLDHSQGLGLWLTYWCVTRWGGDLSFDVDDDGTTVTLTVPKEGH